MDCGRMQRGMKKPLEDDDAKEPLIKYSSVIFAKAEIHVL